MENMKLWNKVCKTDPKITKNTTIDGRKITSIDAQIQRKNATEVFGPYGTGWGIISDTEKMEFREFGTTTLAIYRAAMFYIFEGKEGRLPITSSIKMAYVTQSGKGYLRIDDEFSKKLQTNALTKGLSQLGFNSDVFEGKFDDDKYVHQIQIEFKFLTPEQVNTIEDRIQAMGDKINKELFLKAFNVKKINDILRENYQVVMTALDKKEALIKKGQK